MVSISRPVPVDTQGAVSALYEQHWVGLLRLAVLMVDDRQAAEDVVQEAFAELYRHWPLQDPDAALAYLRTAVVSQVLLVTRPAGNNRLAVKEKVYRCDVRSGECAVALSTSGGVTLYQQ